jgi:hypothetical protein
MARHWIFLTVLGFSLGGCLLVAAWWVYGRLFLSQGPKGQSFKRRLADFRRLVGKKRNSYELLNRQDHSA